MLLLFRKGACSTHSGMGFEKLENETYRAGRPVSPRAVRQRFVPKHASRPFSRPVFFRSMRQTSHSSDMSASPSGPLSRAHHPTPSDADSPPDSPVEAVDATTGKSLPIVAIPPRPMNASARVRTRVFTSPLKFLQPNFPTTNEPREASRSSSPTHSRIMSVPIITVGKNERRLPSWTPRQQGGDASTTAPIGGTLNVGRRRPSAAMKLRDISPSSPYSVNSSFSPEVSSSPTFSTPKTRQTSGIYQFQSPLTCRSTLDVSTTADDDDPIYLTRPHSSYHSSPRPVSFLSYEYAGQRDSKIKSDDDEEVGAPFGSPRSSLLSPPNKARLPSLSVDDSGVSAGNSPFDEGIATTTAKASPRTGGIDTGYRDEVNGNSVHEGYDSFPSIRSARRDDVIIEEDEENEDEDQIISSKPRKPKGLGLGLNTQEINENYVHMMEERAAKAEAAADEAHTPEHDLQVLPEPKLMNGSVKFRRQDDKEANSRSSLASLSAPRSQSQKTGETARRSITSFSGMLPNANMETKSKSPKKTDSIPDTKDNSHEHGTEGEEEPRDASTPEQLPQEFSAPNLNIGKVRYRANGDDMSSENPNKKADRRSITSMGGLRNASVIVKQKRNESGLIPTPSPEQLAIPKRVSEGGDSQIQPQRNRTDGGHMACTPKQSQPAPEPSGSREKQAREKAMERLDNQLTNRDNKGDVDYWHDDGRKANSMRAPKPNSRPSTARSKSESIARPSSRKTVGEQELTSTPAADAKTRPATGKKESEQQPQQDGIRQQQQQQKQQRKKSLMFSFGKALKKLLGRRATNPEAQRPASMELQEQATSLSPPVPPKDPIYVANQSRNQGQPQVKNQAEPENQGKTKHEAHLKNHSQPRSRTPTDRPQSKRLSQYEMPEQQQQQQHEQRALNPGRPERLSQAASTPRTPVITGQQESEGGQNSPALGKASTRSPRSRRNSRPQFGNLNTLL